VPLQGLRHDRNTAISDMEGEWPFPVNGNNGKLKRQGFPLTVNETLGKEAWGLRQFTVADIDGNRFYFITINDRGRPTRQPA
jgi:hypothetical protein